jgi:hypothetical protein
VPRHGWVGAAHMPRSPNEELTSAANAESTWRRLAIRRRCSPTHFNAVSEYQVAHFSILMTSKTSFHNGFVCCLSLLLDHFMPGTSTQLGLRKVRVAFNAKPLYFLASALRHE